MRRFFVLLALLLTLCLGSGGPGIPARELLLLAHNNTFSSITLISETLISEYFIKGNSMIPLLSMRTFIEQNIPQDEYDLIAYSRTLMSSTFFPEVYFESLQVNETYYMYLNGTWLPEPVDVPPLMESISYNTQLNSKEERYEGFDQEFGCWRIAYKATDESLNAMNIEGLVDAAVGSVNNSSVDFEMDSPEYVTCVDPETKLYTWTTIKASLSSSGNKMYLESNTTYLDFNASFSLPNLYP